MLPALLLSRNTTMVKFVESTVVQLEAQPTSTQPKIKDGWVFLTCKLQLKTSFFLPSHRELNLKSLSQTVIPNFLSWVGKFKISKTCSVSPCKFRNTAIFEMPSAFRPTASRPRRGINLKGIRAM